MPKLLLHTNRGLRDEREISMTDDYDLDLMGPMLSWLADFKWLKMQKLRVMQHS